MHRTQSPIHICTRPGQLVRVIAFKPQLSVGISVTLDTGLDWALTADYCMVAYKVIVARASPHRPRHTNRHHVCLSIGHSSSSLCISGVNNRVLLAVVVVVLSALGEGSRLPPLDAISHLHTRCWSGRLARLGLAPSRTTPGFQLPLPPPHCTTFQPPFVYNSILFSLGLHASICLYSFLSHIQTSNRRTSF